MDATAVTITSVFVAGVIGPGITVWAAARAQERRFVHERVLHDLDDVRHELDRLGDALGHLMRSVSWLVAKASHKQAATDLTKHYGEAVTHSIDAWERATRLTMRLGDSATVTRTAQTVLKRVNEFSDILVDPDREVPPEESQSHQDAIGAAYTEFLRAGNELVGAKI